MWFEALLAALPFSARVLEVGAGPGLLTEYARRRLPQTRWVSTDILPAPWNDVTADGLALPFKSGRFDAVVGLDLVHHLARPGMFFAEAARVLAPAGVLGVVEPWVSPLSYPIYRWLHPERCRLGVDPWNPFGAEPHGAKDAFEGDAAIVWRLVRDTPAEQWRRLGFHSPIVTLLNGFAYLVSLGFRPGSLLPRRLARRLLGLDRATRPLSRAVALRVLAVWSRADSRDARPESS